MRYFELNSFIILLVEIVFGQMTKMNASTSKKLLKKVRKKDLELCNSRSFIIVLLVEISGIEPLTS